MKKKWTAMVAGAAATAWVEVKDNGPLGGAARKKTSAGKHGDGRQNSQ